MFTVTEQVLERWYDISPVDDLCNLYETSDYHVAFKIDVITNLLSYIENFEYAPGNRFKIYGELPIMLDNMLSKKEKVYYE